MRFKTVAAGLAVAAAVVGLSGGKASAQSFFEKLFGLGGGASSVKASPRRPADLPPAVRLRDIPPGPAEQAWRARRVQREEATESGPKFRTVCVRLCDGYYFPVSNATSRKNFSRDARACTSQCGEEGRLFYAPDHDEPDKLVDLQGHGYAELPNAFRYRKSLIQGCACKPAPWSEEAMARHRQYALDEEARRNRSLPPISVAETAPAHQLPPPVKGAGVLVISSAGDTVAQAPVPQPAAQPAAPEARGPSAEPVEIKPAEPVSATLATGPSAVQPATAVAERPQRGRRDGRTRETRARPAQVRMIATVSTEKPRPQRSAAATPARGKKVAMAQGGGAFLGPAKYTYPGDAPVRRYR